MLMTQYKEDHEDVNPYEEMVSQHERVSGHDPKSDMTYCETCVIIFNFMVEDGQICRFHPDSYFEPKTLIKKQYCEQCEIEEII